MAIDADRFNQLKRQAREAKDAVSRAQGALQNQLAQLKTDFDCDSVEEADRLLRVLESEEKELEGKYADELHKFEEKFPGLK